MQLNSYGSSHRTLSTLELVGLTKATKTSVTAHTISAHATSSTAMAKDDITFLMSAETVQNTIRVAGHLGRVMDGGTIQLFGLN